MRCGASPADAHLAFGVYRKECGYALLVKSNVPLARAELSASLSQAGIDSCGDHVAWDGVVLAESMHVDELPCERLQFDVAFLKIRLDRGICACGIVSASMRSHDDWSAFPRRWQSWLCNVQAMENALRASYDC